MKFSSDRATAASQQVDDQNDYRDHQQQVDQAARYVKAETQQPQNQQDHKNSPQHIAHLQIVDYSIATPGIEVVWSRHTAVAVGE
jgi:hypothetical protein